jgi:hypothetical protein
LRRCVEIERILGRAGFVLRLRLDTGEVIERDFSDLASKVSGVLSRLADERFFARVKVGHGTLVWPGSIDLSPESIIWGGWPKASAKPKRSMSVPLFTS